MSSLILIRHGQSTYNLENRFTGWKDVPLTKKGKEEALYAAHLLKKEKMVFHMAFTSNLKRAQDTLHIILSELEVKINIINNDALNERDYGNLIGQNKAEAAKIYGDKQVQIWRRSFDVPPPGGESLKMTCERSVPYFKKKILSELKNDKNIILSAHGNSIRAIVKYLFNYDAHSILKTEIGWCEPWCFEFDNFGNVTHFKLLTDNSRKSNSNIPLIPQFKNITYDK